MSDLISRSVLLDEIRERCGMWKRTAEIFCEVIEKQPSVEAKEVVHGKWIGNTCSACVLNWNENMVNNADDWGYFEPMPNFCPNCGADMRTSAE